MPLKDNQQYIVFIREYNCDRLVKNTTSMVYNTLEDAKEAISNYEECNVNNFYAIKLIKGEIIDSIYKEN